MTIELPDFRDFEAFNVLRERMGAERLGYFEAFDPNRHLTGERRLELQTDGIRVTPEDLFRLGDRTLAYRNSRVAVVHEGLLHLTCCRTLACFEQGVAVSSDAAWQAVATSEGHATRVCAECLHDLRFAGLDLTKDRKQRHNDDVLAGFAIRDFLAVYPDYPLYERTHIRHPFFEPDAEAS